MTFQANVAYNPRAKRVRFDKFIDEITLGRPDLADYLQRSLGYAISGFTKEHRAWLGIGRNGKSILAEMVYYILYERA
jgi:putative DNA primase/helicase